MICEPLAYTGPGAPLGPLLTLAIACLVIGAVLLLLTRRQGGRVVTIALLLLVGGAAGSITTAPPALAGGDAVAVDPDCLPADNSLTIYQTSVMEGLAPGIAPVAITGVVSNNGTDGTDIIAIDVEITGVLTAPGSAPGVCEASDYLLLNSRMPVGRTLAPGGSTAFGGAAIGFNNKSTNQDACKSSTILLLYTANPN